MGMDFERALAVDNYGVHARDVYRTAKLCEGFSADVTELREFLDMLGIYGPELCTGYWHVTTSDRVVHYMTAHEVENAERGQPTYTLCRVWERNPTLTVSELREDCTDGDLWLPHCIWCVLKAGVFK